MQLEDFEAFDASWVAFRDEIAEDDLNMTLEGNFMSRRGLEAFIEDILRTTTEEGLSRSRATWSKVVKCLAELQSTLKKAAAELSKHVANLKMASGMESKR